MKAPLSPYDPLYSTHSKPSTNMRDEIAQAQAQLYSEMVETNRLRHEVARLKALLAYAEIQQPGLEESYKRYMTVKRALQPEPEPTRYFPYTGGATLCGVPVTGVAVHTWLRDL